MQKPLLLTHNDMDGSGCAMMVLSVFPEAEVEFHDYESIDDRYKELAEGGLPHGCDGFIGADITSNDEELVSSLHSAVRAQGYPAHLYDHHENREYLNDWEGCRHTFDACATLILAEELDVDEENQAFAEFIDKWDRFQEDDPEFPNAKKMNMLHKFIGQEEFIGRGPATDMDEVDKYIIKCLEAREQKDIERAKRDLRKFKDADGNVFAFVISASPSVAHAVYADDSIDYVMAWEPAHNSASFYSREDKMDVSKLAKARGGGGHEHASGFTVNPEVVKALVGLLQKVH